VATTSAGFDIEHVAPLLRRLIPFIQSGFRFEQVNRVMRMIARTKRDETRRVRFDIRYHGKDIELIVTAFMDDIDSPDVIFETDEQLCAEIRSEIRRFVEELGL
jgi:hypothetical protein